MNRRMRFALALIVSALAVPALAQSTVYTDSAAFLANVQAGAYFNTLANTTGSSFSGNGFGYTVSASGGIYNGSSLLGNNIPNDSFTITFTSGNPTAIGGNFFQTNINDAFQAQPVTITLSDGTAVNYTPTTFTNSYRGFISSVPITSLVLSAPTTGTYNSLSNLTVGRALTAAAPEPGSIALLALGAIGGGAFLRRRKS